MEEKFFGRRVIKNLFEKKEKNKKEKNKKKRKVGKKGCICQKGHILFT